MHRITAAAALVAATLYVHAQDTRTVAEPVIPPACATLEAQLTATGNALSPADEGKLDTTRIQQAIDRCGKGRAVALKAAGAANAFLSGPLELREGVTLLIDKGVTLYESVDPKVLETSPGSCGLVSNTPGRGCKPLISVNHVSGAAIMGDGAIDGRGNIKLVGTNKSSWDLAEEARPGGGQKVSRLIVADHADNFTLYRITLRNSPNFHVVYNGGNGFTVWGVKIDTPGKLARNTDGIDPGAGARNITITHSYISTGDDDVAIKGGSVKGAPGGVQNMTVSHNHFYRGHGMSIGSETDGGVSKVRVFDLSLDGPDNGIRIKSNASRGGLVHDVSYDDVCIRNSPNPLYFDTAYSANGPTEGTKFPEFTDISLHNVRIFGGGKLSLDGYSPEHRLGLNLDGVTVDNGSYKYSVKHTDLRLGPGPVNLKLDSGEDNHITGTPGTGSLPSCDSKFAPFPR